MITINKKQLETFFMSLGWAGDWPDTEVIHGGLIRVRKGSFLHLPMMKLEFATKEEFIDKVTEIAEDLWDRMEETK